MGLNERLALYRKVEGHRKRPLLVYVTSKREGVDASMASNALPYIIDQLNVLPADVKDLDLLIVSLGGDPMVAWRIMSLIRQRVDRVSVLIPQSAYSAATLVALGADEIVMHPNGHLGPVDMQITTWTEGRQSRFSTEDITAFLDFVRDDLHITDQRHLRRLFEITCREVGTLGVGFTARSSRLAVALGEKLLGMHMKGDKASNIKLVIEKLGRQFHSHGYPVSRNEAIEIGLEVNPKRDPALEALMWELWLDLEGELQERLPFSPIQVLLGSAEASKLLSPAPQLDLPGNAPGPTYLQSDLEELGKRKVDVSPVDFAHTDAIIESPRLGFQGITRGKILATRMPDLDLNYNCVVSFRGWEQTHPRKSP
jgi:hypothetical protein